MLQDDRVWSIPAPDEEKDACLQAVVEWLGHDWLNKDGSNGFQSLWSMRDFMSSIELFTVGWACKNQRQFGRATESWFEKMASKIRAGVAYQTKDIVLELLSAAMLNNKKHSAQLTEPGQRGFDVLLTLHKHKKLRISCKVLNESDDQRRFVAASGRIMDATCKAVMHGSYELILLAESEYKVPGSQIKDFVNEIVFSDLNGKAVLYDGWRVIARPLVARQMGVRISTVLPSYNIIVASPYSGNEQRRFENKFHKAACNLHRHFPSPNANETNMVMIKLPESVSIGTAVGWLRDKFKQDYSTVTAVQLYRPTIRSEMVNGQQHFFLNHERFFVENPNAVISWQAFTGEGNSPSSLHLVAPIGRQVAGDPVIAVTLNGATIRVGSLYTCHRGLIHYEVDYPPNIDFSQSIQPSLGMEVRLTFRDRITGEIALVNRDQRFLIFKQLYVL